MPSDTVSYFDPESRNPVSYVGTAGQPVSYFGPINQPQPSGQVLGAQTQSNNYGNQFNLPWEALNEWQRGQVNQNQNQNSGNDYAAQVNAAKGEAMGYLDQMAEQLPGQRTAQENIVTGQRDQFLNTLGGQRDVSLNELEGTRTEAKGEQKKNMLNLAENMRNLMQSGQNYLGTRGAGDSSAANQYAYALTKMGAKEQSNLAGDYAKIQGDLDQNEFKIKQTYDTEANNIQLETDNKMNQIASWFGEQMNQVTGMKANIAQSFAMNMLNQAQTMIQMAKQEAASRRQMLDQWAMERSENVNQLRQNMAGISGVQPSYTQYQGMNAGFNANPQAQAIGYGGGRSDDDFTNRLV